MASTFPGRRPGGGLGMSSPLKSKAGLGSTDMVSDDNFYSNLAAEIDEESDVSEADVSKMLADMDDMDDALFGSSLKLRPSSAAPMQPAQKDNVDKSPSKSKPGLGETFTLDKTLEEELSRALETSSKLEESPPVSPRRGNKPKTSLKKFDFGEFDEDDPLAGLLSDEDDNGVTKKPPKKKPLKRSKAEEPQKSDPKPEPTPELDPAPVSKNVDLAEDDKPSRTRKPESVEKGDQFVKLDASPSKKPKGKTIDFDDDDDDSDILGSLGLEKSVKGTVAKSEGSASTKPSRSRGKGEAEAGFGDESDLLGSLGLEASPRERRRSRPEDNREVEQARSKVNELFGASSTSKMLDKPPAGKQRHSQLDKILQKKDSAPKANVKEEKEENFSFGDYTPSSVTARPESAPPSRRSVRFSDEDDLLGAGSDRSRSRAGMSPYLEEPAQRPRSAAAGMVGSRRSGKNSKPGAAAEDNWLELATGTDGAKPDEKSDTGKQKASATDKNLRVESSPQHRPPLTTSESSTKHETRASPEKVKKEPPARVPSAADYLGLSDTDIDLDSLVQPKALTPSNETPMDSTLDDPFSAPTKRDTISPFPWDGSSGRARPDRLPATSTPQPTDNDNFDVDEDVEEKDPLQTSVMAQQLQQLQKMEEQQQQWKTPPARQPSSDRLPTTQQSKVQTPQSNPQIQGRRNKHRLDPRKSRSGDSR
ncbi:fas-binding factor 1 homolog isoform X2 [Acanthaster planci]|uniref:Fas-binding factor 1 homolog isoform X2 n=1 Tax=Acanthaster planci TaxID=133434 RepID=A0A8B7ZBT3_ACAPL|nr:fas-binding factor 1 homolog isoform X2 [Acanthaster planci]XP_022102436.1 fas-binding factor 1 homolog isoform X2 [Acanthaster planci]XP_022102437.1 fas-binding factor 1 homolog isoform X2 [Acanthaster planci]